MASPFVAPAGPYQVLAAMVRMAGVPFAALVRPPQSREGLTFGSWCGAMLGPDAILRDAANDAA